MNSTTSKKTKEDFGYSEGEEKIFHQYNPSIPKGSFSIQKRNGKYYWYFQLGSKRVGEKTRVKYISPTFDGVNVDGLTSFQDCCRVLVDKVSTDFVRQSNTNTKLITLIDEYLRFLLIQENDPDGRLKYETIRSMKNGINRFRDWSLIRDIRLTDVLNGRKIKQDVIEFVEYCKNKKPNGLKRHTIRTYLKQVKYFMEWLSDEDFGKGSISVNPISSDFIKKVYPPNPMEKKGLPRRNVYFTMDGYDEMWDVCVKKVRGLWNDFIENGWSKTHSNQPLGVGSDVVFFVSLLQLDSGFRVGELLTSFRNLEYHENRRDKKNSSTYWEWKDGEWYLWINWKNKQSVVPITTKIRSWTKPMDGLGESVKDKNGKILYWDTNVVDVCMKMFREGRYLFSSPNFRTHRDSHYSMTYYMNLVKQKLVMDGVGGEGWSKFGIETSHDFRDYFITHKLNSGMSIEDISQISRNSINTIEKHYLRMSVESQLERQKQLDKTRKVLPTKGVDYEMG
jgi:hypothetical protein|tara:strand:+ start:144 stop:1661 length:1518 start_codon:yes stop_codon:yes gene_type:complete